MSESRFLDKTDCPMCQKETIRYYYCAGHERDSTHDHEHCLGCGAIYSGWWGEWERDDRLEEIEIDKTTDKKYTAGEIYFYDNTPVGVVLADFGTKLRLKVSGIISVENKPKIIDIWAVYQGGDELRWGQPEWFFLTKSQADIVAKGKGWYGGLAPVYAHKALVINGEYYLLSRNEPIEIGYTKEILEKDIRAQALAKLNSEEKRILGIKE